MKQEQGSAAWHFKMTEKEKLVLKSSFMDKTAVLDILKTKFGHSRFRSDEQKKAIFTLIGG